MKKKNLQGLALQKRVITTFSQANIAGGAADAGNGVAALGLSSNCQTVRCKVSKTPHLCPPKAE